MKELIVVASIDNLRSVTDFVDEQLESMGCPIKAQMQVDIAVDELFSNIAYYAYAPGTGTAAIQVEPLLSPSGVILRFIDSGVPYDPLAGEDPDTTLSAEERQIGGLGIYMVKKSMDEVSYEYRDGKNILTIKKLF